MLLRLMRTLQAVEFGFTGFVLVAERIECGLKQSVLGMCLTSIFGKFFDLRVQLGGVALAFLFRELQLLLE
jgi:hypothetical protein